MEIFHVLYVFKIDLCFYCFVYYINRIAKGIKLSKVWFCAEIGNIVIVVRNFSNTILYNKIAIRDSSKKEYYKYYLT